MADHFWGGRTLIDIGRTQKNHVILLGAEVRYPGDKRFDSFGIP